MDTAQIIKKATRQLDINENSARLYFDTFVDVISEELQKGNDVTLVEFGEFYLELQYATPCDTDATPINMRKAIRKVVFVPSDTLAERVNRW